MTNNIKDIPELLCKFQHKTENYVKFHEVDSFQVVHNVQYLLWAEVARVEYCKALDINILFDKNKDTNPFFIYLVHSEINYFSPATFFDNYVIHSRVAKLGWSSLTFEHIITKKDDTPLCISQAVNVYVTPDMQPTEIVADIRKKIIDFEGNNLEIADSKKM